MLQSVKQSGVVNMIIDLKELNKRIKDFRENAEPQKLILGYKTYSKLMKEDSFVAMLSKDVRDPMIRYYNEIKIKLVTEKHFFEIE